MSAMALTLSKMSPSSSASASMDGEGDRDGVGDPPTWGADSVTASAPGDSERDHTEASNGKQTMGANDVSIVTEDDGESSILGDGMSLSDGNADLRGLDIAAASAVTNHE